MPQYLRSITLSLSILSLLFSSCKKQMSTDTPLPASYYPSIIVNNDNQVVYALNPVNLTKNWQFGMYLPSNYSTLTPYGGAIIYTPSPLLYNEMVYVAYTQYDGTKTDTVFKLNAKTGALIKKILPNQNEIFNIQATPVASANLIYIAGTNGKVYAIDTGTYITKWEYSANSAIISSPTIYNGNLYFADVNGTVYCIDATVGPSGGSNWTYQPERQGDTAFFKNPANPATLAALRGNTKTTAKFYSSPAIAAPYLYIGSTSDSNVYCIYLTVPTGSLTPHTGVERWRYKTNGPVYSSPAAYAGTCIFGCNDFNVYCLDTFIYPTLAAGPTFSPTARWITNTNNTVYSSPYVYNQVVYVGNHNYNLYALNIINGGIKWQFASKGLIKSSPIAYNGYVYVGSYDKSLYAVDTATGTQVWSMNTDGQIQDSPVIDDLTGNSYNSGISGFSNGGTGNLFYNFNATNF